MSELEKDKIILELQERLNKLEGKNEDGIPTFNYSSIKFSDLNSLVDIKLKIDEIKFDYWFNNNINIDDNTISFFEKLIEKTKPLMKYYKEEDLKLHFLGHLFGKVDFTSYENNFRDFYNEKLTYKTDKFIFNGETDFILSEGLINSEKPYFFIQEFKKGKVSTDPEPQLLAELISAVELNNWNIIKGAYIVGSIWNFVILEKLGKDKYQYFVSDNFDSSKIEDLKSIYKNLVFIKNDIIKKIKKER